MSNIEPRFFKVFLLLTFVAYMMATCMTSVSSADVPREHYVFVSQWGQQGARDDQLGRISDLEIYRSPQGTRMFVADDLQLRIKIFDQRGGFIRAWGRAGRDVGQLRRPSDIAIDGAAVYVADSGNHRVLKFTHDGRYLSQLGRPGSGAGELLAPLGVATDSDGNIYVSDSANTRIQKFSPNGQVVTQWRLRRHPGDIHTYPGSIEIDQADNIYVADISNETVQVFSSAGIYRGIYQGFNAIAAVSADQAGNLYATDRGAERVTKLGPLVRQQFFPVIASLDPPGDLPIDAEPYGANGVIIYVANQFGPIQQFVRN